MASTIRDVSRLAGVSVATVSRSLSYPEKVSPKTRERVMRAVKEARYQPNVLARNFRDRKSYNILVLVPNIANPFFSQIAQGIEEVAAENNYSVLLGDTRGSIEREDSLAAMIANGRADGLIQLNARIPDILHGDNDEDITIPMVNACDCVDIDTVAKVQIDNFGAAKSAIELLLSMGHRRIGVITGPEDTELSRKRLRGCRAAIDGTSDAALITQVGQFTMMSGRDAAETIFSLGKAPTALFCFNDEMAIGALQAVKARNLSVPKDISIIGFDDIDYAKFTDPPLTTIAQPKQEIGKTAMRMLLSQLEAETQMLPQSTIMPYELVLRASTGPAPR